MEKAENRAERKLAKKRKIREARMKDDVGAKSAIPPGALRPFPAKGADAMKGAGTSLKPPPRFPAGTCFECGDPGHWRKECPKVARGSAYPFSNSEHWWMVEKVLMLPRRLWQGQNAVSGIGNVVYRMFFSMQVVYSLRESGLC